MSIIAESEVLRIAALAHLELDGPELAKMTRELGVILAYVRQLEEVATVGVPPTAHVWLEAMPLRRDEVRASLPRDEVMAQAPKSADGGFAVPSFVDEG